MPCALKVPELSILLRTSTKMASRKNVGWPNVKVSRNYSGKRPVLATSKSKFGVETVKLKTCRGTNALPVSSHEQRAVEVFGNVPTVPKRPITPTQAGSSLPLVTNMFPVKLPSAKIFQYKVEISQIKDTGDQDKVSDAGTDPSESIRQQSSSRKPSFSADINHKVVLICKKRIVGEYQLAYDGHRKLYTRRQLPFQKQEFNSINVIHNREKLSFCVQIEYVTDIDFEPIQKFYTNIKEGIIPTTADHGISVQVADTILRTGLTLSLTSVGRAFYRPPQAASSDCYLSGGLEVWPGLCTSTRRGTWRPLVNIDIKCSAFYVSGPLLQLAKEVLDPKKTLPFDPLKMPLAPRDRESLASALKGVIVYSVHLNQKRKIRVAGLTNYGADTETFDWQGKSVSIVEYFERRHNITLERPDLPCAILGNTNGAMVPMELLIIAPGQRCIKKLSELQTSLMIKRATASPNTRFQHIKEAATLLKTNSAKYCTEFDMSFENENIVVQGRRLTEPIISYRNDETMQTKDGVWRLGSLLKPVKLDRWAVAILGRVQNDTVTNMVNGFTAASTKMGMKIAHPYIQTYDQSVSPRQVLVDIKQHVKNVQMTLVVMSPHTDYSQLKFEAETTDLCTRTQCVKDSNIVKKFSMTFAQSLLQKMNAKLGGQNSSVKNEFRPPALSEAFMVVGIDINHSRSGEKGTPSVACLVASMDQIPAQYYSTTSIQSKEPYVVKLKPMFTEALIAFRNENHYLPKQLIIFRASVPDGQFNEVRLEELTALRQACASIQLNYEPPMVFIFVTKRHHVRFLCQNKRQAVGKAKNIPPGTLVDRDIVQPDVFDFYLCSHAGMQGTSRPAHYQVVHNDALQSPDEIYSICYFLCHTNMRCTRSISIPAPLEYANLALRRASDFIKVAAPRSNNDGAAERRKTWSNDQIATLENVVAIHPEMRGKMYFI